VDEGDRFSTLAGFILWRLGHLPHQGETIRFEELTFEVVSLDGRNIDKIRIKRIEDAD
jgi:CBS domain containing-hemolysin-like protein